MTAPYILTHSAAADLREVVRYTLKAWGESQCQAYILNRQRNTYGIRCAAFAAHVRKCLRFAAPAVPAGH